MSKDNFTRMRKLAEAFFAMHNDPDQLAVDEKSIARLLRIHPDTLSEKRNKSGPIAWVLVIPTTNRIMKRFIDGEINERELLAKTPVGKRYDAVYLCSALVLPEFRVKGIAYGLVTKSIDSIRKDHPIKHLFVWSFSKEGDLLAEKVANKFKIPILRR